MDGVILSGAVLQAERRISHFTGPVRKPNCTTTEKSASATNSLDSDPKS